MNPADEGASVAFYRVAEEYFQLLPIDVQMIGVGMVIFFIYWKAMERFVFRPYLALIEGREVAVRDPLKLAEANRNRATELDEDYSGSIAESLIKSAQQRAGELEKAHQQAIAIVEGARIQAESRMAELRKDIAHSVEQVRSEAASSLDILAAEVAAKVQVEPALPNRRIE